MSLNFPDVGENLALGMIVNKTAPQDLVCKLFSNNITPSDTDTAATYTEATFAGYAAINIPGANWNAPAAGSISYNAQITYTRSSTGAVENIYGYYVIQSVSGILLYSERDAAAPAPITSSGDNIKFTPQIGAN